MTIALRRAAVALATLALLGACSSGPSSGGTPAASASGRASAPAPASAVAAGEPCSYLTAQEVGAILGATPVEVAERVGRGDCDYWLTLTRDGKVNIGVFTGPEAADYFESTKRIGTPEPVNVGDEAYTVFNGSIGTLVVARKGDSVVAAQVYVGDVPADQLRQATALVEAVVARL